eukprot:GHVP01065705.1.p1 GENE.GHVP01065705.1~~GHVP01065705.1.p1  ORF type:complete len:121 (+),score=10.99 GHVP01065705.1:104-466(+)
MVQFAESHDKEVDQYEFYVGKMSCLLRTSKLFWHKKCGATNNSTIFLRLFWQKKFTASSLKVLLLYHYLPDKTYILVILKHMLELGPTAYCYLQNSDNHNIGAVEDRLAVLSTYSIQEFC